MASELTWDHAVTDVPVAGLSTVRQATPDELARVAKALDLVACSSLAATYAISHSGTGRYRLTGRVQATLQQSCVVTLEPLAAQIDEPLEATFWPQTDMPAPSSGELDLDEEEEPEPIVDGQIDVGRIVMETLAASIDLFPRKADAALERLSAAPAGGTGDTLESPFAVLARIEEKG